MLGTYKSPKDGSEIRSYYTNVSVNGTLQFQESFSRWQVSCHTNVHLQINILLSRWTLPPFCIKYELCFFQVSDSTGSIVLTNYCDELCPENCKDYFWELDLNVLPIWGNYGKAKFVCTKSN